MSMWSIFVAPIVIRPIAFSAFSSSERSKLIFGDIFEAEYFQKRNKFFAKCGA